MRDLQRIILMASFALSSLMICGCATGEKSNTGTKEAIAPTGTVAAPQAALDKGALTAPEQPAASEEQTTAAQIETAATAAEAPATLVAKPADSQTATAPTPTDGRRIWFVKENNVAIFAEPKDDAKVVGHLARGDHVLATVDGTWATVDQSQYIKADQLSDKPVGRGKISKGKWNGSAAH